MTSDGSAPREKIAWHSTELVKKESATLMYLLFIRFGPDTSIPISMA